MKLGVNIDHVATVRQARYVGQPWDGLNVEPDIVEAAHVCEAAGAAGITVHLRADRRHIQDADVLRLREAITTKLNLEMGNTPDILAIALRVKPDEVCLVPEDRREVTTEGGLDAAALGEELKPTVEALQGNGIRVSLFIEPAAEQVAAAAALGVELVELHTGAFANAVGAALSVEVARLVAAAEQARKVGLRVNAGHGINYRNLEALRPVPYLEDLNIGHSIVSRALFTGLGDAVREMVRRIEALGSA
jgi:pyridoxine 5-phosphate synthase